MKNGKWWIDYRYRGLGRREVVGQSHSLAKELLTKRMSEVVEQRFFPERAANEKTFSELSDKYWDLHGRTLKSGSWRQMLNAINAKFGERKLRQITTADLQRYYNAMVGYTSTSTANRYLGLIQSIFNLAKNWGDYYGDNPCAGVKKGRVAPHRLRWLEQAEITRLLAVCRPRLYPVVACALLTGMRRGEMLGLTWDNVNLERGMIYILRSKSGKPREVPITGKLREILLGLEPKQSGFVFDLPVTMLRKHFDKAVKTAGIVDFCFHDLRHTFASHFIMRTNDLPTLQAILGHSTPAMTMRYAHLSRSHLAANMAVFEAAVPIGQNGQFGKNLAVPGEAAVVQSAESAIK